MEKGRFALATALAFSAWSRRAYRHVRRRLDETRAEIAHIHNFWFMLTPSAIAAARDAGCAVVCTLHNMRLLCPAGSLYDPNGGPCEACLGRTPWRGVWRRCYHRSFFASAAAAWMAMFHRLRGTWMRDVDLFLAPSEFVKQTYVRGGFPPERIVVKPHSVEEPSPARPRADPPRVLFLGRLSPEKGVSTLLAAWAMVARDTNAELRLVGEGPLVSAVTRRIEEDPLLAKTVCLISRHGSSVAEEELASASLLVAPSLCGETFGLTLIEAAARAVPAIGSAVGAFPELVGHEETGLLVPPGDADTLAMSLRRLLGDPALRERLGCAARRMYEERFTPARNYALLADAYRIARSGPKFAR